MTSKNPNAPVILAVLDGWGIAPDNPGNAISQAKTINMDKFYASYPSTKIAAAGEAVGLPRGEAGNTETGHLNLGAGRVVYQDLARINKAIADGSFFKNETLAWALNHARNNASNLHFMGLVGAGGVHSSLEHLYALLHFANINEFKKVFLHLFTDGRDSPPTSSATYIAAIREAIAKEKTGVIASIMGRYWAMDRDRHWERTERAYNALTVGIGQKVKTPEEAIEASYAQGKTDEFIEPALISAPDGNPVGLIGDKDAVVFFNFRVDRPRQLTKAFVSEDFISSKMQWDFDPYATKYGEKHILENNSKESPSFQRKKKLNNLFFAMMTEYGRPLVKEGAKVCFPKQILEATLGETISKSGLSQLRMAESEKERFVTYYFNGQHEDLFQKEVHLITPSPKTATYDSTPEMAAKEQTDKLLTELRNNRGYSFILINYANPDLVAHSGNLGPTVTACEVVDNCLGRIENHILAYGGTLLITADHGNAEEMLNSKTGEIDTEHSVNPVPFLAISRGLQGKNTTLQEGILGDVAPTALHLLKIEKPPQMSGRNLLDGLI